MDWRRRFARRLHGENRPARISFNWRLGALFLGLMHHLAAGHGQQLSPGPSVGAVRTGVLGLGDQGLSASRHEGRAQVAQHQISRRAGRQAAGFQAQQARPGHRSPRGSGRPGPRSPSWCRDRRPGQQGLQPGDRAGGGFRRTAGACPRRGRERGPKPPPRPGQTTGRRVRACRSDSANAAAGSSLVEGAVVADVQFVEAEVVDRAAVAADIQALSCAALQPLQRVGAR